VKAISVSKTGGYRGDRRYLVELTHEEAEKLLPTDVLRALEKDKFETGQEFSLEERFEQLRRLRDGEFRLRELVSELNKATEFYKPKEDQGS
jgi:hypothetical protein